MNRSMSVPRRLAGLLSFALFSFAACGGGDSPTDTGGASNNNGGNNSGGDTGLKTDPSFSNDVMEVLNRRSCTSGGCHGDGQGGLTMTSAGDAYANLVSVTSPNSGEVRVIPGNATDSYLVKKLEGRQSVGDRMPLGMTPLNSTDLQNIKNWINQGAKNN